MLACLPHGHAVAEGDVVQGHVGVFVTARPAEPLLAEGEEGQRGPLGAVGKQASVLHDGSGGPGPGPGIRGNNGPVRGGRGLDHAIGVAAVR